MSVVQLQGPDENDVMAVSSRDVSIVSGWV